MTKISKHNNIIIKELGKLYYKSKEISFSEAIKLTEEKPILMYSDDELVSNIDYAEITPESYDANKLKDVDDEPK